MNLTVACVWVKGHVHFTREYVIRLQSMVARTLPDAKFVCLTDQPAQLPSSIDSIVIRPFPNIFAWWNKLRLFDRSLGFTGRMLYLDLDVLLLNRLREIAEDPRPFVLVPDGAPNFQGKRLKKCFKKFNSSVMLWTAGEQDHLFDSWRPSDAESWWGDQDWIGLNARNAKTWPVEWFPRLSAARPPWPPDARVVLCKKPKNADAAKIFPWFDRAWQ